MTAILEPTPSAEEVEPLPKRIITTHLTAPDRVFRGFTRGSAVFVLLLLGLIGFFLLLRSWPALQIAGFSFLTETKWLPDVGQFGVAALAWGTIVIALIALMIAFPLSLGTALFISEYSPRRIKRLLVSLIDLMAAVPSIVYGLWGFFFLQPRLVYVARWISEHLGGAIPFLRVENPDTLSSYTSSAFIAAAVVSLMIVPTATSIMREVFAQAPLTEREGALALGATRWTMIRTVVIPFGRSGIIGGTMLALGRALGETIAVYLIISPMFKLTLYPLQSGTNSIAAFIATRASESTEFGLDSLLGAGLVLFVFTLAVNGFASWAVSRSRSGAVTEG